MTDDLIRRKDALNFEITVEGPREAEEAILRTSQGIMDYIKSLPAASTPTTFMQPIVVDFESIGKAIGEALANDDIIEVVRCKDCKHRPYIDEDGGVWAPSWDDLICPCLRENSYYSWMPEDDFFCKRGERREDDNDREQ